MAVKETGIHVHKIHTGRPVRTTVYRAYLNGRPLRYKGPMITSDTERGCWEKIEYLSSSLK
jgi:hypothetical protein